MNLERFRVRSLDKTCQSLDMVFTVPFFKVLKVVLEWIEYRNQMASHQYFKFVEGNVDSCLSEFDVKRVQVQLRPIAVFCFYLEFKSDFVEAELVFLVDVLDNFVEYRDRTFIALLKFFFSVHRI